MSPYHNKLHQMAIMTMALSLSLENHFATGRQKQSFAKSDPNGRYTAKSCAYQSKDSYCYRGKRSCKAKNQPCDHFELRKK